MDPRPIGFFDSGIGGVTSIPYIMRMLPSESIIFYGDTARTPYGSKSPETIRQFSLQIGDFLAGEDVKMLVIACNTVSANALDVLREQGENPCVIGRITEGAEKIRII